MSDGKTRLENFTKHWNEQEEKINPEFFYKSKAGDVIIFGPPKTGTTWLQNVLHQIRTKGDESFGNQHDVTWYISPQGATFDLNAEQVCKPRIYKCHDEYGKINMSNGIKSIFIIRDVYDAMYSSSKYVYRMMGGNEDMDDSAMADFVGMTHAKGFLCYFCILKTWWPHRNDPDVYWLFYEDMKKDLKSVVQQLSKFINVPLTESEVELVCKLCSFEHMAENKEKFESKDVIDKYNKTMGTNETWTPASVVRPDGGKVGQGRRNLGQQTSAVIERLWSEVIKTDLDFDNYDQMYKNFSRFKN